MRRGPRKHQSFGIVVRVWRRPDAGHRLVPPVPEAIDPDRTSKVQVVR